MVNVWTPFLLLLASIFGTIICQAEETRTGLNQKLLVISFDGFRKMYFDKDHYFPSFEQFRGQGVYSDQVQSIFPSDTFPNHYAIATGMYAENHGIVANSFYDPALNLTFQKMDIESYWWDQAEPIWITARKQGKRTAVSFWPGSSVTFPGNWTANYFDYYDKTVPFEKRINDTIYHLVHDDVDLAMLYLFQPDHDGHYYGVPSIQVNDQLTKIDGYLELILRRLDEVQLGADVLNVMVCADHGMINVTRSEILNKYVNVEEYFERIPSYGSVTNAQPKPGKLDEIIDALTEAEMYGAEFTAWRKTELPEYYHYKKNDRIMDLIIISKYGAFMTPNIPTWFIVGAHGYDPTMDEMKPIFFARGPAFKKNAYRAQNSFLTKDIYAIMAHVIGMKPLETNATLENAMDIFYTEDETTSSSPKVETTPPIFFTTATDNTPTMTTTSSSSRPAMADFFFLTLLMLLSSFVLL